MKVDKLKVGQKFRTQRGPEVFTVVAPAERVGGIYMLRVEERPDPMVLNANEDVAVVG